MSTYRHLSSRRHMQHSDKISSSSAARTLRIIERSRNAKKVSSKESTDTKSTQAKRPQQSNMGRKPFSDQEFQADVRRVATKLGYTDGNGNHLRFKNGKPKYMTQKEYTNHGVFSAIAISKRFGSFAQFRDTYAHDGGDDTVTSRMFDKENNRVFRVLKIDAANAHSLNEDDYKHVTKLPYKEVLKHYGSYEKIIQAAIANDWDSRIK